MRQSRLLTIAFASAALCFFAVAAVAQAQGQMPSPSGPPSSQMNPPGQNPPGQNPPGQNPSTMPDNTGPTRVDDKKFLKDAAEGGMAEVELGKLAAEKATSPDVKQFGQKMVDDHTKANDQLKEVASKESVNIPDGLDSKHQSRIDKLSKLSGPQFDKAYMKDQLKDHQQDVQEFQSEAQYGTDPNIKQFATQTLPVLQQHLELAKNVDKTTKKEGK